MPEGHTIARVARDHAALLAGKPIRVSSPQGRFATEAALVDGAVLDSIESYGKHLFYRWSTGLVGHVHLGLFGAFKVYLDDTAPPPLGAIRMRLEAEKVTIDLSGPTACELLTEDDRDAIVARLGPDPLRRDARPQRAIERIAASHHPIGSLLLDQRVLCGVGNVYRAEALFVCGINPNRPGDRCSLDDLELLWSTVRAMLRKGVKEDRIVTIDRRLFPLPRGTHRRGDTTYVYHRDVCLRCSTPILTTDLGGRPCYYCPTCQPR